MPVIAVTDETFEQEIMESPLPVLIDLYADWCQPCKQMAPIVAALAADLAGRAKVVKIDVDHNPACAQMFRVSSLPMFVVMKAGKVLGHQLGAVPKSALLEMLQHAMPRDPAALDPEELARLIVQGNARAVDLRDPGSFSRFRIPGALNIPLDDLSARKDELKAGPAFPVLYARGDEAAEVVRQLQSEGVRVKYLEGGLLAWEAVGLEVDKGAP